MQALYLENDFLEPRALHTERLVSVLVPLCALSLLHVYIVGPLTSYTDLFPTPVAAPGPLTSHF